MPGKVKIWALNVIRDALGDKTDLKKDVEDITNKCNKIC